MSILTIPPYPTCLHATHSFTIAQISDLHLSDHNSTSFDKFLAVLALAQSHAPDLLLLTGDLVNDGVVRIYDWLFHQLNSANIPFLCLAGNHDLTHELGSDLPFYKRIFLPINADGRLINTHRLVIEFPTCQWQLLAVNSAVNGQIYGKLCNDTLSFLNAHLTGNLPTIIALHHHVIPVGSAWIDKHILVNRHEFWQLITPQVRAILSGHVHQDFAITPPQQPNCTVYTTPATARQFLPFNDDFALDTMASGFRLLCLHNDQTISSQVIRLP